MLEAVKDLGLLLLAKEDKPIIDILIEDPNNTGKYQKVITINFEHKNKSIKYLNVEIEEYDSAKKKKYLYRRGGGNAPDGSPTSKITEVKKTLENKILGWFNILNKKNTNLKKEEYDFLYEIKINLINHLSEIEEAITFHRNSIPKNVGLFITLKFKEGEVWKYLGDYPIFTNLLQAQVYANDLKVSSRDTVCSLCKEKNEVVFGSVDTYKFYTLDKPGFITGGFNENLAWKNFPVCPQCKIALEEGRKYIDSNLLFKFYGLNYYLIPKFIFGKELIADETLSIFSNTDKIISLKKQVKKRITDDEDEILSILAENKDLLTLNLLFLRKELSAERIYLLIEDILPSRLEKIFKAKDYVDQLFDESFTFRKLRTFFLKSEENKRNIDLDKYFLYITDRIFRGIPLEFHFINKYLMVKIRQEFVNDRYFNFSVRDGLMLLLYLNKLNLLLLKEEFMDTSLFESVFKKYPIFENPAKRGIFLLGALVQLLLYKQENERGTTPPFRKELKSLKMDEKDIKGLLPKVQNKLEEYDSFDRGKRLIAKEVSKYLLQAGDNWKLSIDEINFCFSAGMNLVEEITSIVYKKEEV